MHYNLDKRKMMSLAGVQTVQS